MDIKNRKHAEIFDYSFLSKPIEFIFNKEYNHSYDNLLYGNNIAIKAALKNNYPKDLLIEHGYYFGDYVLLKTLMYKNVVTFSEKRVESINNFLQKNGYKKKKITVITVGPYINYAEGLMTERQKAELKKNFGKILLVFPCHSIEGVIYEFNIKDFIDEIERIKMLDNFNSVFICMYWKDILDNRYVEYYKERGYKIVTAGHRNDPYFLGRLKDIIDLSDVTMSNSLGTHIGYCLARNKPHYIYNQEPFIKGARVELEFRQRNNDIYRNSLMLEKKEILDAFATYCNVITEKQVAVFEKYWGLNEVKYHFLEKRD